MQLQKTNVLYRKASIPLQKADTLYEKSINILQKPWKSFSALQKQANIWCKKTSVPLLLICQFSNICKTGKVIPIYRKYAYNLDQNNSDLLAYHMHAEIFIIPMMGIDLLRHQYDAVVQPTRHSPKQLLCYRNDSFGHFLLLNCENLACSNSKIVQNNWIMM